MNAKSYHLNRKKSRNPCKGNLIVSDSNQEYAVFVNQQLYLQNNNPLDSIISKTKLHLRVSSDTEDEYVFKCSIPETRSYVELTNNLEGIMTSDGGLSFMCDVTDTNFHLLPPIYQRDSVANIIYSPQYISSTKSYLEHIGGSFLVYEDSDVIIVPNLSYSPLTLSDIKSYDGSKPYDFMSLLQFVLLAKNDSEYVLLTDLLQSDNKAILDLLKRGRMGIITFVKRILGQDYFDEVLHIYVGKEHRNKYLAMKFDIYDPSDGYKYISFIDDISWLSYDEMISVISFNREKKTNNFNTTTQFFSYMPQRNNFCKENHYNKLLNALPMPHKPWGKMKGGGIARSYRFGKIIKGDYFLKNFMNELFEKWRVITYYHKPTVLMSEVGYCTNSILIKGKRKEGVTELWEMIFKSDYYDLYSREEILRIINSDPLFRVDIRDIFSDVYIGTTTFYGIFTLRKVPNQKIELKFSFVESPENYKITMKNMVKTKNICNLLVITFALIGISDADILSNQKFNEIINLTRNHRSFLISDSINNKKFFSKNRRFYITLKRQTGIYGSSTNVYRMWYCPKVQIKSPDIFIDLLGLMSSDERYHSKDLKDPYNYLRTNLDIYNLLVKSTDFYDLYRDFDSGKFIYNSRSLRSADISEIDMLLNKFKYYSYGIDVGLNIDFDSYETDEDMMKFIRGNLSRDQIQMLWRFPFMSWVHYPNTFNYNVFHMHIAHMRSKELVSEYVLLDRLMRYLIKSDRSISYDIVRQIDLSERNIECLTWSIIANIGTSTNMIMDQIKPYTVRENKEYAYNMIFAGIKKIDFVAKRYADF